MGERAIEVLDNVKDKVQVICNLESGVTNPHAIKALQDNTNNIELRSCSRLHAKVYWSPSKVVVTSANLSANGLSYEDDEMNGWHEAGVVIENEALNSEVKNWFDSLWKSQEVKDINDADIEAATLRWLKKRENRLPQQNNKIEPKESILTALQNAPSSFKDKKICFIMWAEYADERDEKAVKKAVKNGLKGLHTTKLDWYVDLKKIPKDTYIISFKYSSGKATEFMLRNVHEII